MKYKIILEGGLQTKNSPSFSSSAFLLSASSDFIGVKVDAYLTNDNEIIVANEETLRLKGINKKYINTHTFLEIQNLNLGNKVKKHNFISLNELLLTFSKTSKSIVINLIDEKEKNQILIDKLVAITSKYNNLYVKSSSIELINLLLSSNINSKIGINITENNDWNYNVDFYCIIYPNILNTNRIYEKYNSNKEIMISDVNSYLDVQNLTNTLFSIIYDVYLITKTPIFI